MRIKKITAALIFVFTSTSAHSANQVTNHAIASGFRSCLSTLAELENFFAKDKNYGSWSFTAKENSNVQPINSSIELTFGNDSQIIDFNVTPTSDGTCSYSYTRTWYSEKSCIANTSEEYLAKANYKMNLNKNISAFEDSEDAKILLMPAGSGCIVQKKQIGYRYKKYDQ